MRGSVGLVLAFALAGCGSPAAGSGEDPAEGGAGRGAAGSASSEGGAGGDVQQVDDPDPQLSASDWDVLRTLSPATLPKPGPDKSNAWAEDEDAATFGKALFFDARFSGALLDGDNDGSPNALGMKGDVHKVSCAGCHLAQSGFSDTRTIRRQISLAAGWVLRRTPSLLDVAQGSLLMWDGRRDSFFSQAFGPLESPLEMNSSRLYAAQQVLANHREAYEAIFGPLPPLDDAERFPKLAPEEVGCRFLDRDNKCTTPMRGSPGDGAEYDGMTSEDQDAVTRVWVNVGKSLGAYQRLLECGPGRFDAWVQGDETALSRSEQRGAALFVSKAGCVNCHSGPFLSDEKFHNVGLQPQLVATVFIDSDDPGASVGLAKLREDPLNVAGPYSDGDDGRIPKETPASALGAFRTPRLRCVTGRPSLMHTGQFRTVADAVEFFNRGGDMFGFPGTSELKPLSLSTRERADLVAFLDTLTGPGPAAELLTPP